MQYMQTTHTNINTYIHISYLEKNSIETATKILHFLILAILRRFLPTFIKVCLIYMHIYAYVYLYINIYLYQNLFPRRGENSSKRWNLKVVICVVGYLRRWVTLFLFFISSSRIKENTEIFGFSVHNEALNKFLIKVILRA